MRQSPRFRYLHSRDSRGDYCFKLCSRAKRYLHQRGFYLADERRKPSSPCLKMLHSQLPVDGGGDRSETGCLCGVSALLCYFPLLNDSQWTPRDASSHLFWTHACVLMCLWGDDGVRLIEYQLAHCFFLCYASVYGLLRVIFQVFSCICAKIWSKWVRNKSYLDNSFSMDTLSLLPKRLPQLRYYLQFHLLLHLKKTGKIWLTLAVRRLILNSPQAKMSG